MLPGDLKGSPDESLFSAKENSHCNETLVFIDEGFLAKLSKHLGKGRYVKFDKFLFAKLLAQKERLDCRHIFYYTAPPFQSNRPTRDEELRKRGYDRFIKSLKKSSLITIREGRCQRLLIDSHLIFKQKYVDVLLTIDLMRIPLKYPQIQRVILISSDSDFVPAIHALKEFGIKVILYTFYEKKRNTNFSRSNDLVKAVHKYVLLTQQDFLNAEKTRRSEHAS
ncbi:MAG: NYN domain-containing protein [Nanoarchaeota archaeon]